MFILSYVYICMKTLSACVDALLYIAVDQNSGCRGPPMLQTFVAGPLLQTLVADLCVEYCSLQGACRGGFVAEQPHLLQTFVAKWPPKPVTRPMFLIRCHISVYCSIEEPTPYICICVGIYLNTLMPEHARLDRRACAHVSNCCPHVRRGSKDRGPYLLVLRPKGIFQKPWLVGSSCLYTIHHILHTLYHWTVYTIYHIPYSETYIRYTLHHVKYSRYHKSYTIYCIPYTIYSKLNTPYHIRILVFTFYMCSFWALLARPCRVGLLQLVGRLAPRDPLGEVAAQAGAVRDAVRPEHSKGPTELS